MQEEVPVAKEFWLALTRNDRAAAQEVDDRLDLPLVITSTFSFEEIEGEFQDAQEWESLEQMWCTRCIAPQVGEFGYSHGYG